VKAGLYADIYNVVRRIPSGMVATYGQIACIMGRPNGARQVGWALAALRHHFIDEPVPWQRVVAANGEARIGREQIDLLQSEGVVFDGDMHIDLALFGWDGLE